MADPTVESLDDLLLEVGSNEEQTEWVIRVFKESGDKVLPNEFILELEAYLHNVSQSLLHITDESSLH